MEGGLSTLYRKKHIGKLTYGLTGPLSQEKLVPVQTWTVYWITHALSLLEQQQYLESKSADVIQFLRECAHPEGGYGGGPGQIAHLATTFASVNALITMASEVALESIDRVKLIEYLRRMKQPNGSFSMHDDGEVDSRATYCALSVLRCLNIQDSKLLENVAEWILQCQTYEGGFGSEPGAEAHGGYTFCCVASLCLLNQLDRADVPALLRWLTHRQLTDEGGFCGRSNKLVDSCYSYWQGAVFPMIHSRLEKRKPKVASQQNTGGHQDAPRRRSSRLETSSSKREFKSEPRDKSEVVDNWMFDCGRLQDYILNRCQANSGLLKDKPGATPDFYHTCYALSGLSICQHQPNNSICDIGNQQINILAPTHPIFNVTYENLNFCFNYFKTRQIETTDNDKNSGSNNS